MSTAGAAPAPDALAVLTSGGLDSAVLLGEALRDCPAVFPLYVRHGLAWEAAELNHLRRFLDAVRCPALRPLIVLEMPVADLYGDHWSVTGRDVPDADSPDEAVYLPGRNILLLAKAMLWCQLHGVGAVALAPLAANPFPDATPAFFDAYQAVVNRGTGGAVRVLRPYAGLSKAEVMRRGRGLPLEWTFSCIRPAPPPLSSPTGGEGISFVPCPLAGEGKGGGAWRHCGRCNKCAERRRAFADAGLPDRTEYHQERPCTA